MFCTEAPSRATSRNVCDMGGVHAGDADGIDLDQHPTVCQFADGPPLVLPQQRRRVGPPAALVANLNPSVNAGPHGRVDRVDGDGNMREFECGQLVDIRPHVEAVGRHAQQDVGVLVADQPEGAQGLLGVSKRIARPGNSHHRNVRSELALPLKVPQCFLRRYERGRDARPRLVDAGILAVAELALHVAACGHREVNTAMRMPGLDIEAGMVRKAGVWMLADHGRCGLLDKRCVLPAQ